MTRPTQVAALPVIGSLLLVFVLSGCSKKAEGTPSKDVSKPAGPVAKPSAKSKGTPAKAKKVRPADGKRARPKTKTTEKAGDSTTAGQSSQSTTPPKIKANVPISDDDCLQFAKSLEAAVASGNSAYVDKQIDWDVILTEATHGLGATAAERKGMKQGAIPGLKQGITKNVLGTVARGGSYRLLRVHTVEGRKRALFRLVLADDEGFNYHDMLLDRRPSGDIKIVDMYVFLTGELLSKTLRQTLLPLLAKKPKTALSGLSFSDLAFISNVAKLNQMSTAWKGGRAREALNIYKQLPASLRNEKSFLLMSILIAQKVDNQEYADAMEAFRKRYPYDACVDMISIDAYFLKKQFGRVLECIDRVDQSLGGDPYLHCLRAKIHMERDDLPAARSACQTAIDAELNLQEPYLLMIACSLDGRNFEITNVCLKILKLKFGWDLGDLTDSQEYSLFVKSESYRDWIQFRMQNK